jgi:hypothetical protein
VFELAGGDLDRRAPQMGWLAVGIVKSSTHHICEASLACAGLTEDDDLRIMDWIGIRRHFWDLGEDEMGQWNQV